MEDLPKGMYRRPNGTYYGAFVDQEGRRVRRALGRDRARAITAFRRYRGADSAPTPTRVLPSCTTTLGDVLDLYLEHQQRQHRDKPRTLESAGHAADKVRQLMDPLAPIDSLVQEDFWAFRDARAREVGSRGSVNVTLRYLKAALNRAVREGLISAPPFRVELLPEPPKRNRALSTTQVERVLQAAEELDPRAHAICYLAYTLGLRLSEIIAGLWWRDVDLEERWLQVEAKPGWSPKTRQRRVLTLDADVAKFLAEWRARLGRGGPNDYVVPRDLVDGEPLTRRWAGELASRAFRRAGVRGGVHALRHSFVTEALEVGVPVHVVQRMAGHSSVQTTLGAYAHVRDSALREAAELLATRRRRLAS